MPSLNISVLFNVHSGTMRACHISETQLNEENAFEAPSILTFVCAQMRIIISDAILHNFLLLFREFLSALLSIPRSCFFAHPFLIHFIISMRTVWTSFTLCFDIKCITIIRSELIFTPFLWMRMEIYYYQAGNTNSLLVWRGYFWDNELMLVSRFVDSPLLL